MATKQLIIHTDGSCKNVKDTPSPMGIGVVVKLDGEIKYTHGGYAGDGTNNIKGENNMTNETEKILHNEAMRL